MNKIIAVVILILLSGCSAHDVGVSILGGAKNWCRHSGGSCHVDGKPAR